MGETSRGRNVEGAKRHVPGSGAKFLLNINMLNILLMFVNSKHVSSVHLWVFCHLESYLHIFLQFTLSVY